MDEFILHLSSLLIQAWQTVASTYWSFRNNGSQTRSTLPVLTYVCVTIFTLGKFLIKKKRKEKPTEAKISFDLKLQVHDCWTPPLSGHITQYVMEQSCSWVPGSRQSEKWSPGIKQGGPTS